MQSTPCIDDLISHRQDGRTFEDLEAASGGHVKALQWRQLVNGVHGDGFPAVRHFPDLRTTHRMAMALGVPVRDVILSFAQAIGHEVDHPRPAW